MLPRWATTLLSAAAAVTGCKFPELPIIEDDGGVDADLNLSQRLTVAVTGDGRVTSNPARIDCGAACAADFDPLSSVALSATAGASSVFEGWSGDCSGAAGCDVTMDGPKSVAALFRAHGALRWADQLGMSGEELGFKAAVDGQGDVVVAGTVTDGADNDLFAIKYRGASGDVLWTRHFDTPSNTGEFFADVAVDGEGNVYLAMTLQSAGAVMFDTVTATGDVFGNIVVLRLAGDSGTAVWASTWGGAAADRPTAIAVAGADLYVAGGTSSSPSTFDGRSVNAQTNNGFVAKAALASGAASQVKLIPGVVDLNGVAVDGADVAVIGVTRASAPIDASCAVSPSGTGNDVLVIDLMTSTLACRWAKTYGDSTSNNDAHGVAIAAFVGGGWAVTGHFEGSLGGFGPSSLGSRGQSDIFIARIAADGQTSWAYRYGDAGYEVGRAIATTSAGQVLCSGDFNEALTLGAFTLSGTTNTFVTRMSNAATPTHEWAVSLGGNDVDGNSDVALAPDGSVFITSEFVGMTTLGDTPLSAQGRDIWVAALVR